jgi:hypothetical protein
MDITPKTEIDIDQLKADFGDYYLNGGQNLSNLHMLPFISFDTRDAFTIVPTNDTIVRESNVEFTSVLQQYQDEFTPKGGVAFEPVEFILRQMKVDQKFNPTKLQSSWVGFLASNNLDRSQYPFVRWIYEVYLTKQSQEDMELESIYNGIYVPPVEGVAGDAAGVMNGVRKIVTDLVAAGKLTEIVTGVADADPAVFVTQIESFVKSWPERFRKIAMPINMSQTLETHFKEGMQKKYNMQYAQVGELLKVRNHENVTVAGRPSMAGAPGWWATPKLNAIMPVKGFENANVYRIETAERFVKMFGDWWATIGFIQPKLLFVNDQVAI